VSILVFINVAVTSFKTKLQQLPDPTDILDIPWIFLFYFPCIALAVISPQLSLWFNTYGSGRDHAILL